MICSRQYSRCILAAVVCVGVDNMQFSKLAVEADLVHGARVLNLCAQISKMTKMPPENHPLSTLALPTPLQHKYSSPYARHQYASEP